MPMVDRTPPTPVRAIPARIQTKFGGKHEFARTWFPVVQSVAGRHIVTDGVFAPPQDTRRIAATTGTVFGRRTEPMTAYGN